MEIHKGGCKVCCQSTIKTDILDKTPTPFVYVNIIILDWLDIILFTIIFDNNCFTIYKIIIDPPLVLNFNLMYWIFITRVDEYIKIMIDQEYIKTFDTITSLNVEWNNFNFLKNKKKNLNKQYQ
jgi:hypothetical protein